MVSRISAFEENKMEIQPIQPVAVNQEKIEFKIPEVGQVPSAQVPAITPAVVYDSASLAGSNLRNEYKAPDTAPKGDINYACTTLGNTLKDTVTGLLGALKSSGPDEGPAAGPAEQQLAMAAPRHGPQPFGL